VNIFYVDIDVDVDGESWKASDTCTMDKFTTLKYARWRRNMRDVGNDN